jgi:hypothetical protein
MREFEISGEIKTTTDAYYWQSLSGDDHKASQTLWKERVKQQQIHLYRGTDYWLRNFITNIVNMRFP